MQTSSVLATVLLAALCTPHTAHAETYYYSRAYYYTSNRQAAMYKKGSTSPMNVQGWNMYNGIPPKGKCAVKTKRYQICGDADQHSGSVYVLMGDQGSTTPKLVVTAGQHNNYWPSPYNQAPKQVDCINTPYRSSSTTTFTGIKSEEVTFSANKGVNFFYPRSFDGDSLRCNGKDMNGVTYNDPWSSSWRIVVEFEYVAPGTQKECAADEYREDECDIECKKCNSCGSGFYMKECKSDGSRTCERCTAQPSKEHYLVERCTTTSDAKWAECYECGDDEYPIVGCTWASDRLCAPHSPECDQETEYEAVSPSSEKNRICLPRKKCVSPFEYEYSSGSASTDRVCLPVSKACEHYGGFEEAAPTPTSDRKCATPCGAGTFKSGTKCLKHSDCSFFGQYTKTPGNATHNAECVDYTQCKSGTFLKTPSTPTSDNECVEYTVCGDDEVEVQRGTPTSDNVCEKLCLECALGHYEKEACTDSKQTVCEKCTECGVGEMAVQGCTQEHNRKCVKVVSSDFETGTAPKIMTAGKATIIGAHEGGNVVLADPVLVGADSEGQPTNLNIRTELMNLRAKVDEMEAKQAASMSDDEM